jgi:hypothetical protein
VLGRLREAGAAEQAAALAARAAAHVSLDDPYSVASLLDRLREAGAAEQGGQDRFWFGREADGSPSGPWGWDDLD